MLCHGGRKGDIVDTVESPAVSEPNRMQFRWNTRYGWVWRCHKYRSLAFGLSVAPRVFSKLMRFALEPLRAQGIRLVYYLDDICILSKTKQEMSQIVEQTITHLTELGFIINY